MNVNQARRIGKDFAMQGKSEETMIEHMFFIGASKRSLGFAQIAFDENHFLPYEEKTEKNGKTTFTNCDNGLEYNI